MGKVLCSPGNSAPFSSEFLLCAYFLLISLCKLLFISLPGSSVHGIFQTWILEWVAISFSRGSSQPRDYTGISHVTGRFFTILATREALLFSSYFCLDCAKCAASSSCVYVSRSVSSIYIFSGMSLTWPSLKSDQTLEHSHLARSWGLRMGFWLVQFGSGVSEEPVLVRSSIRFARSLTCVTTWMECLYVWGRERDREWERDRG